MYVTLNEQCASLNALAKAALPPAANVAACSTTSSRSLPLMTSTRTSIDVIPASIVTAGAAHSMCELLRTTAVTTRDAAPLCVSTKRQNTAPDAKNCAPRIVSTVVPPTATNGGYTD